MNILLFSTFSPGSASSLIRRGFEQAGHVVVAASPDPSIGNWIQCDTRVNVSRHLTHCSAKPDLVMFVESNARARFFPDGWKDVPVPTAFCAIDSHLNFRWHKEYAAHFDVAFFAQKDYIRAAHQYGATNVRWLPLAADALYHQAEPRPGKYAVSFVGSVTRGRRAFFDSIGSDIPLNIVTGVYEEEMAKILSESEIGINLSIREDLNMRFFEVLASGALLVTQKIDAGMNELFEEGTHFITHRIKDARSVLQYYLDNEAERARIAQNGRALCLSRHTYRHRCEEILQVALADAAFMDKRLKRLKGYRADLTQSLVYSYPSFKMTEEARQCRSNALKKNRIGAYAYLLKYFISYIGQSVQKMFKKTIW